MSWKTTSPICERQAFIVEYQSGDFGVAELARRFGVSRKTAYKWLGRFEAEKWEGLENRSRAPHHHPNAVDEAVERMILEMKARRPGWGAPKIRIKLQQSFGSGHCLSESSISRILQRHGLSKPRGRRRPRATGTPLGDYTDSNTIWCADFKGWFPTADGVICTPLTISDGFSRYLLKCQGLTEGTGSWIVKPIFEATMREYGMPEAIRTDNGAPFASCGLGGLTELSIWWLRLGIRLERIRPGCPQENGRHERMHRTLKEATAQPPRTNLRAQQRAFDEFRQEYNEERPHEALDGKTPAEVYEPSARSFPDRLPEVEYGCEWKSRNVRESGQMKWEGKDVYVNRALAGERIGLEPIEDGVWKVYFASHELGIFDERRGSIQPLKRKRREKQKEERSEALAG